ncbi:MAG: DOMON domain-containing protein, partial [Bacteroidota bacterium]
MRLVLFVFLLGFACESRAQKEIRVQGMKFTYQLLQNELEIELSAPTQGWLGIGFNRENNIVKSDLLLFRVKNGQAEGRDMYVLGFGNPRQDQDLGGKSDFRILAFQEKAGSTWIRFRIPLQSGDDYDFSHRVGEKIWLILAYSVDDDFGHHSRMRQHLAFQLK